MIYDVDTGMMYDGGYNDASMTETTTSISVDGLMSSWGFVGGISVANLVLSIVIGLLLAKAKIKKGFDVYED